MASLMNGLSALGAGVAQFAGTAGIDLQRSQLAQQQTVLADKLAATRESVGRQEAGQIAATAADTQRTFLSGQATEDRAFKSSITDRELGARASEGAANRASEMARSQLSRSTELTRAQMMLDADSPEIKSAKQFAGLSEDQKKSYRDEMMTKAGLPAWMTGGDTPSSPTGSGAVSDMPGGVSPDGVVAPDAPVTGTPDPGATRNDKALGALPPAAVSIVKGMVDGRISPPSSFAMSKPYWQGLLAKAAEYDPTFDQTTWSGRVTTKKDFASGKSAQAVTALNTALGHAGVVDEAMTALNNGSMPFLNAMENWTLGATGDARPTSAKMAVDALASEARKVFAGGGGGNLAELQEWQKNFPIDGSPKQQSAALRQFTNLLDSRLESLSDQYNRGMGRTDDPINLLQPHAREVYERLTGREPSNATGYQLGKPPAAAAHTPAVPTAPTTSAAIPAWVKPGDQYSASRGQARGADGTVYGPQ